MKGFETFRWFHFNWCVQLRNDENGSTQLQAAREQRRMEMERELCEKHRAQLCLESEEVDLGEEM